VKAVRMHWDILVLAAMAVAILLLLIVIADSLTPMSTNSLTPIATNSLTPIATNSLTPVLLPDAGAWWTGVPVTATPTLAGLPGLPDVKLSGGSNMRAGEPVEYAAISCPRPDVKITSVTTAGKPGWWNIVGTAAIPNQEYWKGEISADGQHWTLLYRSNRPVWEGLLIEFNTRTVPKGAYQIRLLAVDRTGNYPEPCVIGVTVR